MCAGGPRGPGPPQPSVGGKIPPSSPALVPGGHRQQSLRDLYGGLWSGCMDGTARQRARPPVPRSELGELDGSGRGARSAQNACR